MQVLFRPGGNWHRNYFNAQSPMHNFVNDIENRRSKLFPDRRRVPGRKMKYIAAVAFLVQIWACAKMVQIKRTQQLRDMNMSKLFRKVSPYFSSLGDVEYTIIQHRFDLIVSEAFKSHGGAEYVKSHLKRFHNPDLSWAHPEERQFLCGGHGRYKHSMEQEVYGRFFNGLKIKNV